MAIAMTGRPSWPHRPALVTDTWTCVAAAYLGVRTVVILLGL
jgi:hypothetical protein